MVMDILSVLPVFQRGARVCELGFRACLDSIDNGIRMGAESDRDNSENGILSMFS